MRTTPARGALVALGCVLLGACVSHEGGATQRASARTLAISLAAVDAQLAERLKPRDAHEGFERDGQAWTSAGWRGAAEKRWSELGVRLGERADEAYSVGVSQFPALRLRLVPREARSVQGRSIDGHVVYEGAYGDGIDALMASSREWFEELLLIRHRREQIAFSWDVTLPSGITHGKKQADGSVVFFSARGERVLSVPSAYAVDAHGTKRTAELTWDEPERRLGLRLDAHDLAFPVLLDPAFESTYWERQDSPPPRFHASMAFDAATARMVLFGGSPEATAAFKDTWTWDGVIWRAEASPGPSARAGASAAANARLDLVLFGGNVSGLQSQNDTWFWNGGWTRALVATSPPKRWGAAMAYDAARGKLVLFGGRDGPQERGASLNDTWTWDVVSGWTQAVPATSPPRRSWAGLAYDSQKKNLVLFGGQDDPNVTPPYDDTWTWDGTNWTRMSPPSGSTWPAARTEMTLVASPNGGVMLYGGSTSEALPLDETWTWDGRTWTLQKPTRAPPARYSHAMALDPARVKVVLFGGIGEDYFPLGDTWTWDGTDWLQVGFDATSAPPPPHRGRTAMAQDPKGDVLLFGGFGNTALDDTWTWSGRWTEAHPSSRPPARFAHAMAYDPQRGKVVLFGGLGSTNAPIGDTWTWDGANWTQRFPASAPLPRCCQAMAYDGTNVVLFGGSGSQLFADTWSWNDVDGDWKPASPATSPSARYNHAMAYDSVRGNVILFGGASTTVSALAETWVWSGGNWSFVAPSAIAPAPRSLLAMASHDALGKVILFGGTLGGSQLDDTWAWDGSAWSKPVEAPNGSPPGMAGHGMAFQKKLGQLVLFGQHEPQNQSETWTYHSRGGSCSNGTQCTSGFCVDGVCCEMPSCGVCQACNRLPTPGICSLVTNEEDFPSCNNGNTSCVEACAGDRSCSAEGRCLAAQGQSCRVPQDCASGFCVDGFCCESACTDTCRACAEKLTGTVNGKCDPARAGDDPHEDCIDERRKPLATGSATGNAFCALRDGTCDGKARCSLLPRGTVCDSQGTQICDGLGTCITPEGAKCRDEHTLVASDGTPTECAPYKCAPSGCLQQCTSALDCTAGATCALVDSIGRCVSPQDRSAVGGCSCRSVGGEKPEGRSLLAIGAVLLFVGCVRRREQRPRSSAGRFTNPSV